MPSTRTAEDRDLPGTGGSPAVSAGVDGLRAFTAFYHRLPPSTASAPVFAILFGEARLAEMKAIAALTGGQVFDGRTQPLTPVFAAIRGNQ